MPPLLRELLKAHRQLIAVILGATLVSMLMSLAMPWPLKVVLDNVVAGDPPPKWIAWLVPMMGGHQKAHIAAAAGVATVAIALVSGAAFYVASYTTERLGQCIGNDLRVRLYHHLQELSLAYYDTNRVGTILSTLTTDVQTIQSFASTSTLNMLTDTMTLVAMVVVMLMLRWDFALIALAVAPLLIIFLIRVNKAIKTSVAEVRTRQSDLLSTLQEGLQSIEVVQAYSREDYTDQKVQAVSRDTVTAWLKTRRVSALLSPVVSVIVAACTGLVLWRGALLVLHGGMTAGALTVFLSYLARFFQPVRTLSQMTNTLAQVSVGFQRVTAVCDADVTIPERPAPLDPPPFKGAITFDHVSFSYDSKTPVLKDISFSVEPGQMVGIVGPTGSGKSTLVSLIPRFRNLDGGRITIDGVDTADYTLHGLRTQIGFVLQNTVLLRGTIRENIAFGCPDATEDDIILAAKMANADEFIDRMPDGYCTLVGDRGSTLSGGQRQRIGIARALIRNNPILILDEPTAALDAESEHLVIEALERLMEGRTVITIAHRLSTLRGADKIIVVKEGVVVEDGSHEELMRLDGVYAQLHRLQFEQSH
ncbi:ABC transporter ATP-binding protein [Mycolicibacterium aubagnense]|uniref:Protein-tyrosine-phosphatase n=1 Tax=Mycolicibacterium aubagnense TaxID=319707 RepID=A0ABM7IEB4_9MYCO|nr:ABC transporter ATP-binding protein [Mycolicibacterium aubagnense]TLH49377.1 ABC transporter ATP-binding protein [Mycolicibacterium aubagnense]WGI33224.1 ABC transporter ATP-binding protein [Mycolicibacterium aubagnense]BBX85067.1 protein-tyrosine-phosphatase [Mycolicibacterium aubagnense]